MDPPSSSLVDTHICIDYDDALAALRLAQDENRPILMKNFWTVLHPSFPTLQWSNINYLKEASIDNPAIMAFCQSKPGNFPEQQIKNLPFHAFLDEWGRRKDLETGDAPIVERQTNLPAASPEIDHSNNLQGIEDIFLGNVHIEQISAQLQREIAESPFETIRKLRCEELKHSISQMPETHFGTDCLDSKKHCKSMRNHSESVADQNGIAGKSTLRTIQSACKALSLLSTDSRQILEALSHPMEEKGRVWIGNANHVSHLHFDAHHGLLITLFGQKRVQLFHPLDHIGVIPKSPHGNHAELNPMESWPSTARPLICDLFPSDALFIPVYWWHLVSSVTSSVAINFWAYPDYHTTVLKLSSLWKFSSLLCSDHIKAALAQSKCVSPLALLPYKQARGLLAALLRCPTDQLQSAAWQELLDVGTESVRRMLTGIE